MKRTPPSSWISLGFPLESQAEVVGVGVTGIAKPWPLSLAASISRLICSIFSVTAASFSWSAWCGGRRFLRGAGLLGMHWTLDCEARLACLCKMMELCGIANPLAVIAGEHSTAPDLSSLTKLASENTRRLGVAWLLLLRLTTLRGVPWRLQLGRRLVPLGFC